MASCASTTQRRFSEIGQCISGALCNGDDLAKWAVPRRRFRLHTQKHLSPRMVTGVILCATGVIVIGKIGGTQPETDYFLEFSRIHVENDPGVIILSHHRKEGSP